jgi:methionyl-tRNA formyltransferase
VIHAAKVDADVTARIAATAPDAAAIVAYGGLIPRPALDIPRHGWINLHFSLLPAWRGAAPVQRAVIAGDDITGAVTFLLEEGLDTGPVFGTLTEAVRPDDTSGALLERLSHSGAVLLAQTLSAIEAGRAVPVPQSGAVSLAPKLGIDDGRINWHEPALAIGRRARGVTPEPGAWTTLDGQRVKLEPVVLRGDTPALLPGQVLLDGKSVLVGTGSHPVELTRIQPSGKKMMAAADWARGQAALESVVFE